MLLKSKPEDFIVEEINDLHLHESGSYSYYKLKKTNLETNSALQKIADLWKINPKYINIAGNKDKVAITTQFLSISKGPEKDLKTENLELTFLGKKNDRLNLGTLDGNKFTITVRKISAEERINLLKNTQRADFLFVNYYDDQRFGIEKTITFLENCSSKSSSKKQQNSYVKEITIHIQKQRNGRRNIQTILLEFSEHCQRNCC